MMKNAQKMIESYRYSGRLFSSKFTSIPWAFVSLLCFSQPEQAKIALFPISRASAFLLKVYGGMQSVTKNRFSPAFFPDVLICSLIRNSWVENSENSKRKWAIYSNIIWKLTLTYQQIRHFLHFQNYCWAIFRHRRLRHLVDI